MNGKMLIKVTLNEATDPDLFAYLMQFDNARLRAGAFRALASAAARGDHTRSGSRTHERTEDEGAVSGRELRSQAARNHVAAVETLVQPGVPMASPRSEPPFARNPRPLEHPTIAERRFDTDAIGEQFAGF